MVVLNVRRNKGALLLGAASVVLYAAVAATVTGPLQTREWLVGYAAAWGLYLALFLRARDDVWVAAPAVVLAWAFLARMVLVGTQPWLSDDLYRYLFDGRVAAAGLNPYALPPSDPTVVAIAPELAAKVNHPEIPTIYPPLVQLFGWLSAWSGIGLVGWRVLMSLVDLGVMVTVARLFGRGPRGWRAAAVYGLCPLAIWESGANGHVEGLALLPLIVAVAAMQKGHGVRAGVALGLAALAKYYALILLPLWIRARGFSRMAVVTLVVVVGALLPFARGGVDPFAGLRAYLEHWSFNSPLYSALATWGIDDLVLRAAPFVLVGVAGIVLGVRREDPLSHIPTLLFAFLVIGPTLHPWYALWVLPWLGDRPHPGHWSFVAAMGGAYAVWWSVATTGEWVLPPGVPVLLWGLVALGWLVSFWRESGSTPEAVR